MNTHPIVLLEPFFHRLDEILRDYGLYLYMVCVWLSPLLIAWILSGGFWRRPPRRRRRVEVQRRASGPPPLPPVLSRATRSPQNEDTQSFAA